jgi:two-component system LytT family sensor kinase
MPNRSTGVTHYIKSLKRYKWSSDILFWTIVLFLFTFREGAFHFDFFLTQAISVFFYILLIYFNLYYLIPVYLTEKRFWLYCLLLILAVLLLIPIKILILYLRFSGNEAAQQTILNDQETTFIAAFTITGGSTIFKIISDWAKHQREKKELEKQTMQSELRFLKSQINPHFLFNTLNNLYALTLKKSEKAPEIVLKLSEMMRYMLYECNEKYVPLSKEVAYMQNYIELEKLRQGKGADMSFEIHGEIRDQKITPLLLIPFIENSFKHGVKNTLQDGFVHITMIVEEQFLQFEVINSKPALAPKNEHNKSGGIGLVNVQRRLNLIYPDKYELQVNNTPNTYQIILTLTMDEGYY